MCIIKIFVNYPKKVYHTRQESRVECIVHFTNFLRMLAFHRLSELEPSISVGLSPQIKMTCIGLVVSTIVFTERPRSAQLRRSIAKNKYSCSPHHVYIVLKNCTICMSACMYIYV